jgi:hypothetical protein
MGKLRALAVCAVTVASGCSEPVEEGPDGRVVVPVLLSAVHVDTETDTIFWHEDGYLRSEPPTETEHFPPLDRDALWRVRNGVLYRVDDTDLRVWEDGTERTIATGLNEPRGATIWKRDFDLDDEAAYLSMTISLAGVLERIDLVTGERRTLARDRPVFGRIAQDDERLFWDELPFAVVQVEKRADQESAVTTLIDKAILEDLFPGERTPQPSQIASDADALYVTINNQQGASTGGVLKIEKSTGLISVLAVDDLYPLGIAVDDRHVYYTRHHDSLGAVVRLPKEGGEPEVIAARQLRPASVHLTSTRVYWVNRYGPELDPPSKNPELRSVEKP